MAPQHPNQKQIFADYANNYLAAGFEPALCILIYLTAALHRIAKLVRHIISYPYNSEIYMSTRYSIKRVKKTITANSTSVCC